jgi:hypothetical protein
MVYSMHRQSAATVIDRDVDLQTGGLQAGGCAPASGEGIYMDLVVV